MRPILLILLLTAAPWATAATRPPAVAGAFYPGDRELLGRQVKTLIQETPCPDRPAVAVVVPHAGYVYSGATAARSFACLAGTGARRVVLLGPSHHTGFAGGALPGPGITAFTTPLGDVSVDRQAVDALRGRPQFAGPAEAHGPEHSLEVQLPFLQTVLPGASIVPVLVGLETDRDTALEMARSLSDLVDEKTVVVVSSDFTHHGARYGYSPFADSAGLGDRLLSLGRATAALLAAGDADGLWQQLEVSGDTVCGRRPLAVLAELVAHAFQGSGRVLDVTTSGHLTGSWDLSVTYAAVAFEGSWHGWREDAPAPTLGTLTEARGEALVELARATLRSHLMHDESLARWYAGHGSDSVYRSLAGAFVTLNNVGERARREGRLRACMGVIEARQPLADAVVQAAVSAVYDPRFPRVSKRELDEIELEVSALSPTREVPGPDAIQVGVHGVVLSKGGRRAVFLPQVATEQGWDRDAMLDHLAQKAGLPTDGWRHGARFEVFTAQVFEEQR